MNHIPHIDIGGGQVNDFTLSLTSVQRQRQVNRQEVTKDVVKNYTAPEFPILHWDSKLFKGLENIQEDRIAIYISSPSKLIGIPKIVRSTGEQQKQAVLDALKKWEIKNDIVGCVFDTTASNTGKYQGAVALIEKHFERAILWLPCRHHVAELHIKSTAGVVTGHPNSPGMKLFQRFRDEFSDMDFGELKMWKWPENLADPRHKQAMMVKDWMTKCLSKKTFPREDYRELSELIAFCLGGQVERDFFIRTPGGDHHARFMSKAIYY